jgi:hypothetical protein
MISPQLRKERRDFRFPLHLPVLVRMPPLKEMHARSENISMGGILLSSAFLIPEGSAVEVSIGVDHMPDPGILLSAPGKVLRVRPKDTGEFELAIRLDSSFRLPHSKTDSVTTDSVKLDAVKAGAAPRPQEKKPPASVALRNPLISSRGLLLDLAWQTET